MHRLLKEFKWVCQSSQGHPRMAIPTVGEMSCLSSGIMASPGTGQLRGCSPAAERLGSPHKLGC